MEDHCREMEQRGARVTPTDYGYEIKRPDGWTEERYEYGTRYRKLVDPVIVAQMPKATATWHERPWWKQLWARWVCFFRTSHLWHYGNPERRCERCGEWLEE